VSQKPNCTNARNTLTRIESDFIGNARQKSSQVSALRSRTFAAQKAARSASPFSTCAAAAIIAISTWAPGERALAANSELKLTFDLTVAQAGDFAGYNPYFKIQWRGSKSGKYDLVSQTLTPSAVPLPAALPLLLGGIAGLGFMRRRKAA